MIATFQDSVEFVNNLKAALRAACVDPTRDHMNCVLIEIAGGLARFVATNGHWVWLNEIPCVEVTGVDEKGKELLAVEMGRASIAIGIDDARAIIRGLDKSKKAHAWRVELDTEKGTVSQLGKVVAFSTSRDPSKFPPYAQIVPQSIAKKPTSGIVLAACYLEAIGAAFQEIIPSDKTGSAALAIEPTGGDLDPVLITSRKASALVVLMPCRDDKSGLAVAKRYAKSLLDAPAAAAEVAA